MCNIMLKPIAKPCVFVVQEKITEQDQAAERHEFHRHEFHRHDWIQQ